jgi:hypothetical protein
MNSQEELMGCLWQLTEVSRQTVYVGFQIVRDGDAPSVFCAVSDLPDMASERSEIHPAGSRVSLLRVL